jgi:hypothetical protein
MQSIFATGLCVAAAVLMASCDDFLRVENPNLIDAGTLDPKGDAATFSLSARQNFATAYGSLITYSAWFVGEALSAETFPAANEFGRRDVSTQNGALNGDLWQPLSIARTSADKVLEVLAGTKEESASIDLARAALFSGYSFLFMAEHFCQGVTNGGPPLTTGMMLDSAVARFTRAHQVGRAAAQASTGAVRAEAAQTAEAALVGRARAHLQAGRKVQAAGDADRVPTGFVFSLLYADDPSNRARLGNRLWHLTFARGAIAVAPAFRKLNDPRVPVSPPQPDLRPFDGITPFWTQAKYTGYGTPIRLASKIEADYIAAEARGTAAMVALIQARRAANQQPAYTGPTDEGSVRTEFMEQRAREFFLEGKALGDFRRNPDAVRYVPRTGAPYHKPGYEPIRNQVCYPLPKKETANNPNFPNG